MSVGMPQSATSGDSAAQGGTSLDDQAAQATSQVTDQAKQTVSQAASTAQQQAKSQLASQKQQATESLGSVSQALHQVSSQLRQNNQEPLANGADMAAMQVDRLAGYLRNRSINQLVGDVENVARQQPQLFLAGAFALGVVAARFLKSSSQQGGSQAGYRSPGWQGAGQWSGQWPADRQDWSAQQPNTFRDGAPFGAYDPGTTGMRVREIPQ